MLKRFGIPVAGLFLVTSLATFACSSGSSKNKNGPNCTSQALTISFDPMYSSTDFAHEFQIPAIVSGISASAVAWYAVPNDVVSLTPGDVSGAGGLGNVMITVIDAGSVTIYAEVVNDAGTESGVCGSSPLTIETCTQDEYDAGFERYYYGPLISVGDAGCSSFADFLNGDYGNAACTNCHGAGAQLNFGSVEIATVQHTPQQTGGFTDDELVTIITDGGMPDASYFVGLDSTGASTGLTYAQWHSFHHWKFDSDFQLHGIICFLRGIAPQSQTGAANFGGRAPGGERDGGNLFDGGGNFGDGGRHFGGCFGAPGL